MYKNVYVFTCFFHGSRDLNFATHLLCGLDLHVRFLIDELDGLKLLSNSKKYLSRESNKLLV